MLMMVEKNIKAEMMIDLEFSGWTICTYVKAYPFMTFKRNAL